MPRQILEYRLLDDSLRELLSEGFETGDVLWPKYGQLFKFLRENLDRNGSEREYAVLRRDGTGPAPLVEGLIEYLLRFDQTRLVTRGEKRQLFKEENLSARWIQENLTSLCSAEQVDIDWRDKDHWRLLPSIFSATFLGDESQLIFRTGPEVDHAARWFMKDVGRGVSPENYDEDPQADERYLALGAAWMKRSLASHQEQWREWWKACPWSIAKATYGGDVVGVGGVLPLDASVYERLRSGKISDFDIRGSDLLQPSRYLHVNALTSTYSQGIRARIGWVTARQITTLIYQAARVSWTENAAEGAGQPIRLLAIGGIPANCKRLERHGYTRVGTLYGFDVPLYELIMPAPETAGWFPRSASHAYAAIIAACYSHIRITQEC